MKANVGSYDAAARFVAGCALLLLANHGHRWGLAGLAIIATAVGFCPLYWLFRIQTTCWIIEQPVRVVRDSEETLAPRRAQRAFERTKRFGNFSDS
jgi:hypothetical protein